MYRLHLYLTDDLKNILDIKAKVTGKTKAEIARNALEAGLKRDQQKKSNSAQSLIDLASQAEGLSEEPNADKNLSLNHDVYAWGNDLNK